MTWRARDCQRKGNGCLGGTAALSAEFVSHVMSTFFFRHARIDTHMHQGCDVQFNTMYGSSAHTYTPHLYSVWKCIKPSLKDPYQFETTIHHCNFSRSPPSASNCYFQAITLVTGIEPPDNFESPPAAGAQSSYGLIAVFFYMPRSCAPCHQDTSAVIFLQSLTRGRKPPAGRVMWNELM